MAATVARPDYDQTLKRLLTRAHDGVLALLLPDARWLGERSPELLAVRRQADLVWEVVRGDAEHMLLHVELQTNPDPLIGERLAEYALRLWRRDRLPVYSVVVYLREGGHIPDQTFVIERGDRDEALRFRYEAVRLWEESPERVLATPEAAVWPLAVLMAGTTTENLAVVGDRIAQAPLHRSEQEELTGLLAMLAGLRLPRFVVEQTLRRNPMISDLLRESSVVEWWLEEGREEGQRTMAQAILESRFGPLDEAETAALRAAAAPVLRDLAVHLATDSREQIRARLGLT